MGHCDCSLAYNVQYWFAGDTNLLTVCAISLNNPPNEHGTWWQWPAFNCDKGDERNCGYKVPCMSWRADVPWCRHSLRVRMECVLNYQQILSVRSKDRDHVLVSCHHIHRKIRSSLQVFRLRWPNFNRDEISCQLSQQFWITMSVAYQRIGIAKIIWQIINHHDYRSFVPKWC